MFVQSLLVPLDGSKVAEAALPYAIVLARSLGASVRLLAIVEHRLGGLGDRFSQRKQATTARETRSYLAQAVTVLHEQGIDAEAEVHTGVPAKQILNVAERMGSSAIVMATHGRSGIERLIVGSVADEVMRSGVRPALLVPPHSDYVTEPAVALKRIMVPLDGSAFAETALLPAGELAAALGARLELVRAEPALAADVPGDGPSSASERADEATTATIADYLTSVGQRLPPGVAVEPIVLRASPLDVIAYAHYQQVDLVVMTTHGHGGIKRFLIGSIADRMVRFGIPTLLVPPGTTQEAVPITTLSAQ
jgi:nucleotide-binding universal stress UspA family protein